MAAGKPMQIAIVAACNDEQVLAHNLLASPDLNHAYVHSALQWGFKSAANAYNCGIDGTSSDLIVFTHQDVFLPLGWIDRIQQQIETLEQHDPNWGVIGAFGINTSGQTVGRLWSNGLHRELGDSVPQPVVIETVDEVLFVVRRQSHLRFDESWPGFHLYGTDICMKAELLGLQNYVCDLPVIHNSVPVTRLDRTYRAAYNYCRTKYMQRLPIQNCVATITKSNWPLWKAQLRLARKSLRRSTHAGDSSRVRHPEPVMLCKELGY